MSKLERHEVTSEDKDTAYIATVLLFNNVKQMAMHKIGGWELYKTSTNTTDYAYVTEYRNGKMYVRATSCGDNHIYTFGGL